MAAPLTQQLQKDCFGWSSSATFAFEQLKNALSIAPVLRMPNFSLPFVVDADASGLGLGAVLMQDGHPVAYFSKGLGPRGQSKPIYEKELMAIVLVVQKWRHYLLGRRFTIWTDERSLHFIMQQHEVGAEYQKWVSKLMGFDFEIKFKSGSSNAATDAF